MLGSSIVVPSGASRPTGSFYAAFHPACRARKRSVEEWWLADFILGACAAAAGEAGGGAGAWRSRRRAPTLCS